MTRVPDFIVIGAMKAGTTTLFRWLGTHPECALPTVKEPSFFARPNRWKLGMEWYCSLFPEEGELTGEASVIYTDPRFAGTAARRIAATLPKIRLVFVARHPLTRARSHYVHQVQRGRERRTFDDAVRSSNNLYTARSCYFSVLQPYANLFAPDQLAVIWFEELFAADGSSEWSRLLRFLGLTHTPRPSVVYNRSVDRPTLFGGGRWLWDRGIRAVPSWLPAQVLVVARSLLSRDSSPMIRRLISSAETEVDGPEVDHMWEDVDRFLAWAGSDLNRWR